MLGGVLLSGNFFVEMEISGAFRDYDAMMVFFMGHDLPRAGRL